MKKLSLFALAAVLWGCSQPSPRDKSAPAASQPAKEAPKSPEGSDTRPLIACFGDSLTAGLGLDAGQSYPDVLQADLDKQGYHYRVGNFGVSGDTSQDGFARMSLVVAEKPVIVVLEFGANDGLRGQPVGITRENLAQMITGLEGSGAHVVLAGMTLPPNYGPAYIAKFKAIFPDLAATYKVPLIPFLLSGVGGNDSLMQRDGLHPNAEGARIVAGTVLKTLSPLLKQ